ncbi:hypothetical protein [Motilibacter aurantiacus]|uniref:hypothetical protein n=1 Tax=Motilibacter aurantiacus TaxID=2714955 RepID=UPI001408CE15|nr:hypothetical protein [Motilibacter aurantiacus]NHC46040.1 hypothetical protein [Motilibacter aurantiacus]
MARAQDLAALQESARFACTRAQAARARAQEAAERARQAAAEARARADLLRGAHVRRLQRFGLVAPVAPDLALTYRFRLYAEVLVTDLARVGAARAAAARRGLDTAVRVEANEDFVARRLEVEVESTEPRELTAFFGYLCEVDRML